MSNIDLLKDCVETDNGTALICYDCVSQQYYKFKKEKINGQNIAPAVLDRLLRKIAAKKAGK